MRLVRTLLVILGLCSAWGIALADEALTLNANIGFGGYYRPQTLVPIAVTLTNNGDTIHGEFRVTTQSERVFSGHYTMPVTIPHGANQLQFLYITPQIFARDLAVEFWSHGTKLTSVALSNCQEIADSGRLLVVSGGNGASFNYLGTQQIHPDKPTPTPRPWDVASQTRGNPYQANMGQANAKNTGILSVAYVDRAHLPDNPEAYGSVSVLALMSDTTENNLPESVQEALPQWVATGGHLLIAGGGIAARLQSPFFTRLLPLQHGKPLADAQLSFIRHNGGQAVSAHLGAGRVTALSYDPDMETADLDVAKFYVTLFKPEPSMPASVLLHQNIDTAIMVRNLQPPNLMLIIVYLLVYLVMLVPVNYFVLKKIDKREMAWITTPIIVLLFTLGAYGIGYVTKGHRLVLNQISVLETSGAQHAAEAVSEMLIFSPSRTSYDLDLGENGLFAGEINRDENNNNNNYYNGPNQPPPPSSDFNFVDTAGKLEMRDISVNMWDFRQLSMVHSVNLQGGFATALTSAAGAATGTITNNTPFHFAHCELLLNGGVIAEFALDPQQTVTVDKVLSAHQLPTLNEDQKHMYEALQPSVASALSAKPELQKGMVLFGYTTDPLCQARLSGHAPTANLSLFVVHLP